MTNWIFFREQWNKNILNQTEDSNRIEDISDKKNTLTLKIGIHDSQGAIFCSTEIL